MDCLYTRLAEQSLAGECSGESLSERILNDPAIELLPLSHAAFVVRQHYHGKRVGIHVLNNVRNGLCTEDCSYCAQGCRSNSPIEFYPDKELVEILVEARQAHASGAKRYCLVFSGRAADPKRITFLCQVIKRIKAELPLEVCVSTGFVDAPGAEALKAAGLDRLNHNVNTSAKRYESICTSHTYQDRIDTLHIAKQARLEVCSGMIVGMGEGPQRHC